jgi:hypothetical protein
MFPSSRDLERHCGAHDARGPDEAGSFSVPRIEDVDGVVGPLRNGQGQKTTVDSRED